MTSVNLMLVGHYFVHSAEGPRDACRWRRAAARRRGAPAAPRLPGALGARGMHFRRALGVCISDVYSGYAFPTCTRVCISDVQDWPCPRLRLGCDFDAVSARIAFTVVCLFVRAVSCPRVLDARVFDARTRWRSDRRGRNSRGSWRRRVCARGASTVGVCSCLLACLIVCIGVP